MSSFDDQAPDHPNEFPEQIVTAAEVEANRDRLEQQVKENMQILFDTVVSHRELILATEVMQNQLNQLAQGVLNALAQLYPLDDLNEMGAVSIGWARAFIEDQHRNNPRFAIAFNGANIPKGEPYSDYELEELNSMPLSAQIPDFMTNDVFIGAIYSGRDDNKIKVTFDEGMFLHKLEMALNRVLLDPSISEVTINNLISYVEEDEYGAQLNIDNFNIDFYRPEN